MILQMISQVYPTRFLNKYIRTVIHPESSSFSSLESFGILTHFGPADGRRRQWTSAAHFWGNKPLHIRFSGLQRFQWGLYGVLMRFLLSYIPPG